MFCSRACTKKYFNDFYNSRKPRKTSRRSGIAARETAFTDEQKQLIYGAVLGDASLIKLPTGRVRFSMTQGPKQLHYLQWKRNQLAFAFHKETPIECNGKSKFYVIGSVCHPFFEDIRPIFYPNGKRYLPPGILDQMSPLTLAVWYMDDGSFNPNPKAMQVTFCTDRYGIDEIHYAREVFKNRFGLNSSVYKASMGPGTYGGGIYYRLVVLRSSLQDFFDIVRPFIHPSMNYKVQ